MTNKESEAEAEYRKAIALLQKLADDYPAVTEFRSGLAGSLNNLGLLVNQTGRQSESEAEFRKAIALIQKLADDNPAVTHFHYLLAGNRSNLSVTLAATGKVLEAEAEQRKAIALLQKLADDNPAVIIFRMALATSHRNLGDSLSLAGKPTEAEAEFRAAVTIFGKVVNDDPKILIHREMFAVALNHLGGLLLKLGRSAEALDAYGRAFTLFEPLIKANPADFTSNVGQSLVGRGRARRALGDPAGAAADVRQALRLSEGLRLPEGYEAFSLACSHAALAGLAGQEGTGVSAAEGKAHADQAMPLLRKSVDGYGNIHEYRAESALDSLREREDFKKLLAEMEQKSAAKPK